MSDAPGISAPSDPYASAALIDAMQDGLLATGADGRIVRVSPSFCRITGFSEEELVGASRPFPFWPEEAMDEIVAATRRFRGGTVQEFDLTFRHKDGRRIPVIISAALIDGGPAGVAVVRTSRAGARASRSGRTRSPTWPAPSGSPGSAATASTSTRA